jgi:hypothetical protein
VVSISLDAHKREEENQLTFFTVPNENISPLDTVYAGTAQSSYDTTPNLPVDTHARSDKYGGYVCCICSNPYTLSIWMRNHLKFHLKRGGLHGGNSPPDATVKLWGCGLCTEQPAFDSSDLLLDHMTTGHSDRKAIFCGWDLSKVIYNLLHHPDFKSISQTLLSSGPLLLLPVWKESAKTLEILRKLQRGLQYCYLEEPQNLVKEALVHASWSIPNPEKIVKNDQDTFLLASSNLSATSSSNPPSAPVQHNSVQSHNSLYTTNANHHSLLESYPWAAGNRLPDMDQTTVPYQSGYDSSLATVSGFDDFQGHGP